MAIKFKYTPEQFDKAVKAYHALTETRQMVFPDIDGLKNSLMITDEEYDAMEKDERYFWTCMWAKRRRASWLQRAAPAAKNTTGIKMLLSQPENGGYVEKPVDKTPRQISVILRGMDDEYDADDDNDSDNRDNGAADRLAGVAGLEAGEAASDAGTGKDEGSKPHRRKPRNASKKT